MSRLTALLGFLTLLREQGLARSAGLFSLVLACSLTEGISLLLLVPMIGALHRSAQRTVPDFAPSWLDRLPLPDGLGNLLLLFVTLVAVRGTLAVWRDRMSSSARQRAVDGIRARCFEGIVHAEWHWISRQSQAELNELLVTDVNRIGLGFNQSITLAVAIAGLCAHVVVAAFVSWPLTLLAAASGGMLLLVLARYRRGAWQFGVRLGASSRALHSAIQQALAGIKLAKILGSEQRHAARVASVMSELRRQQTRFQVYTSRQRAVFEVIAAAMLCCYLYLGLVTWAISLPTMLTLIVIFARLAPMLSNLQGTHQQILHALPALQHAQQVLGDCRRHMEPRAMQIAPLGLHKDIAIEGVTFTYPGRELPALDDLHLRIPVHTTTAVMGESGSGKSTLADLLIGLIVPDRGRILIDGEPLQGERRMRWRGSVAYVPQEVFLFNDSVRNNLLWAAPDASEQELHDALTKAAAGFVFALPEGLDSQVGENGIRLSGGERQRLALARALLTRPSLLILDEATSALDAENELRVRNALRCLHGQQTLLVISHRLSTLEHADQRIVLAGGRLRTIGAEPPSDERGGGDPLDQGAPGRAG